MKLLISLIALPFKLVFFLVLVPLVLVAGLLAVLLGFLPFGLGILGLLATVFWIWMLAHAILNDRLSGLERLTWVLLVWFLPFFGALGYFLLGRASSRPRFISA